MVFDVFWTPSYDHFSWGTPNRDIHTHTHIYIYITFMYINFGRPYFQTNLHGCRICHFDNVFGQSSLPAPKLTQTWTNLAWFTGQWHGGRKDAKLPCFRFCRVISSCLLQEPLGVTDFCQRVARKSRVWALS